MEFKRKLMKSRKQASDKRQKKKGMLRIKIRGRKRWVKPKPKSDAA